MALTLEKAHEIGIDVYTCGAFVYLKSVKLGSITVEVWFIDHLIGNASIDVLHEDSPAYVPTYIRASYWESVLARRLLDLFANWEYAEVMENELKAQNALFKESASKLHWFAPLLSR